MEPETRGGYGGFHVVARVLRVLTVCLVVRPSYCGGGRKITKSFVDNGAMVVMVLSFA